MRIPTRLLTSSLFPLAIASTAVAQDQAAPPVPPIAAPGPGSSSPVPGWNELVDRLRALPEEMLARLPENMRRDPQVQQEVGRLALEALTLTTLQSLGGDGDRPVFLPGIGQVLNVGQPNADTVYRSAKITPGGSYRLRGRRGSLRMVRLAQAAPNGGTAGAKPGQVGAMRSYLDINKLRVDGKDGFDLLLSPQKPAGYKGDWWQLDPATNGLMMRMVGSDWARERDPTLSIERIDVPATRPRPTAADLEQRLRTLPRAIDFIATLFVDHVEQLRQQGYVNKLKIFDVSQMGALTGQFYYEGAYDLADDEALIVESPVPARCTYRSLILTNELYETTDWYNNQSSLNDAQALPDKDGILRIVVSAKDPGVPNWLDTAGHPRGVIQGRWTECATQPIPTVKKVPVADIRKHLPPETAHVTARERDRALRDRRSALQQRPLW